MAEPGTQPILEKAGRLVVIDLGGPATIAVHLEAGPSGLRLLNFNVDEMPPSERDWTRKSLKNHFRTLLRGLGGRTRQAIITLGMDSALLRTLELPRMRVTDMRRALKLNPGKFFRQDVAQYAFDCSTLSTRAGADPEPEEGTLVAGQAPVLIGGVPEETVKLLRGAARDVGLRLVQITLRQVSLANAALFSLPEDSRKDALAVMDLSEDSVSISALLGGRLVLSRGVEISADLSQNLQEAFTVPYPVAGDIRQKLIRTRLQNLLFPLGHDICSAIDYFESQLDRRVSRTLIACASERTCAMAEILQQQFEFTCQRLDLGSVLAMDMPADRQEGGRKSMGRFSAAAGAAAAWFCPGFIRLNLMAEEMEAEAERRRDPVRWTAAVGGAVVVFLLAWAGFQQFRLWQTGRVAKQFEAEIQALHGAPTESAAILRKTSEATRLAAALDQHSTNRFLTAPALSALQQTMGEEIQVIHLNVREDVVKTEVTRPAAAQVAGAPAKISQLVSKVALVVQAKSHGDAKAHERFLEAIVAQPYFRENLRPQDPVVLKNCLPRQVDPLDPTKVFTLFTVECIYPDKVLGNE